MVNIVVFGIVIVILFLSFQKAFKFHIKKFIIKVDYSLAPIMGIIILFITFSISVNTIITGIVGTETIKPYSILILFMSMAYLTLSIDATGAFEYIAYKIAKSAGNSGMRLFIYFYFLSSVLTIFTSNDIVILTLTPIIIYLCKFAKIDPIPYIVSQFFAANIWSITLYIGNPTNIIVAQAFSLSFLGYLRLSLLPAIVAGVTALFLLWIVFKNKIPKRIEYKIDLDFNSLIKDKFGAILGLLSLLLCLITLSFSSAFEIEIWIITLFFSIVMSLYHIFYKIFKIKDKSNNINYFKTLKERMPWKIIPFTLGMFILVQSLVETGWIGLIASGFSYISINLLISILVIGFLSAFSCNVMNNQPMTIFFTQVLLNNSFVANNNIKFGIIYSLIIGSNLGANFTLIGALAGIMWYKIAQDKDVNLSFKDFAKLGFKIMPLVILIVNIVLFFEISLWF